MAYEELEQNLDLVIKDLVDGLTALAETTRCGGSAEDLANRLETMAAVICKHWPTCLAAKEEEEKCQSS
jgi:hypothetical protein